MIKILLVLAQVYCQLNGIPYTCDPNNCKLPNCKCATNDPPVANPPQFIVITFDDSVQEAVMPQAKATFANRKNPNGCNAKATWFAQVLYSNPLQLTKWYAEGNEIADHSVTHVTPFAGSYAELEGMRAWANAFAGIPRGKIRGVRFPFRSYSVESMELVAKMGFEYDSSMASLDKPIWPYTLDNGVVTECLGANPICGKKVNAKGLWELPMYGSSGAGGFHLMDPYNDFSLANPIPPQQVTDDLMNAFNQHYNSNKAPFGVYMHPLWIGAAQQGVPDGAPKLAAINKFLDQAMANTDVWLVTNYQIIQYMRNPVSAAELGNQEYMKCGRTPPANICNGLSDVGVESCPYNSFQVLL
jgi:peptidoglycan/xylan/chitin deacetylase (PgdA/CDA1 family)